LAENREEGSIAAVRFSSSTDRAQMAREVAPAATLQQHPHGNALPVWASETFH
jgi:hypothetical protein